MVSAGHGPADAAADAKARAVVERLMATDAFSRWLGVEILDVRVGHAVIRMTVRPEMVNGFGIAHGGIVHAFADSALAFTTNSDGEIRVALDTWMSYPSAIRVGDVLTATGALQASTSRTAFAEVTVRAQDDRVVGLFRGTVYRVRQT